MKRIYFIIALIAATAFLFGYEMADSKVERKVRQAEARVLMEIAYHDRMVKHQKRLDDLYNKE